MKEHYRDPRNPRRWFESLISSHSRSAQTQGVSNVSFEQCIKEIHQIFNTQGIDACMKAFAQHFTIGLEDVSGKIFAEHVCSLLVRCLCYVCDPTWRQLKNNVSRGANV